MGEFAEDDSQENLSGAFDHEEHAKQMNELNRRMVEGFDRTFVKGEKNVIEWLEVLTPISGQFNKAIIQEVQCKYLLRLVTPVL